MISDAISEVYNSQSVDCTTCCGEKGYLKGRGEFQELLRSYDPKKLLLDS